MKTFALLICVGLGIAGTASAQAPGDADMNAVMGALGALMQGSTNAAATLVDFRDLKAMLPAELPGYRRTAAGGERTGAMGISIAKAEGSYESGYGARVTIRLTDTGGTGLASMMGAGIEMADIDRESDDGYERSTTIAGQKAIEEYNTRRKSGSVKMFVAKRFLVEIEGDEVAPETLTEAATLIDLAKLATLKPKAPANTP